MEQLLSCLFLCSWGLGSLGFPTGVALTWKFVSDRISFPFSPQYF